MTAERIDYFRDLRAALKKYSVGIDAIDTELRDHFALRFAELIEQGLSSEEAAAAALAEFGDPEELAGAFGSIVRENRRRMIMRTTAWGIGSLSLAIMAAFVFWPASSPTGIGVATAAAQSKTQETKAEAESADDEARRETELNDALTRNKLTKRTGADFEQTPLNEAISQVAAVLEFEYYIDRQIFEEQGIALDTPVSLSLKNARGDTLLGLMLRQTHRDLAYTIRDGIVFISFMGYLDEHYEVRVYNVEDLADRVPLEGVPAADVSGTPGLPGAQLPAVGNIHGVGNGPATGKDRTRLDFEALRTAITTTIKPPYWQENGGNGSIAEVRGMLVINQTKEIHFQVENLLKLLREAQQGAKN